jgi:hypothetical protein
VIEASPGEMRDVPGVTKDRLQSILFDPDEFISIVKSSKQFKYINNSILDFPLKKPEIRMEKPFIIDLIFVQIIM